jgi:hypothetical protein
MHACKPTIILHTRFQFRNDFHHKIRDIFMHNLRSIVLTVNSCIKVRLDLQADKSPVVIKGPFFPRVVNPRYRILGTNVWCKRLSSNAK